MKNGKYKARTGNFFPLVFAAGIFIFCSSCLLKQRDDEVRRVTIAGTDMSAEGPQMNWLDKRMEDCNTRGYTWVAIVEGGKKPSRCGEPLVDFACTKEEIKKQFPELNDELTHVFSLLYNFRLYNCGKEDDGVNLHFYVRGQNKGRYKVVKIKSAAVAVTQVKTKQHNKKR